MTETNAGQDAIIIGAGIIGCAIALSLRRRGFRTLNIDQNPSPGYGSTSYSAAIIRPYYSTQEGTSLALEGHYVWANWTDYLRYAPADALDYRQCGCLVLEAAENQRLRKTRAILSEVGVPYDDVDEAGLRAFLPGADLRQFGPPRRIDDEAFGETDGGEIAGGVFCPTGGYVTDPQQATRHIARAVTQEGGKFLFGSRLTAILQENDRVTGIRLADGTSLSAPIVVNAAGPFSAQVNAMACIANSAHIGTRALRQEVAHMEMPRDSGRPSIPCVLTDADTGIYMRPESNSHLLIGSLEPACDTLEYVSPEAFNENLSDQWTNQVWRAALRFPQLAIPNTAQGFAALYDVSDDWIPVYDGTDLAGFFTAIGTSGNQFKNAPVVGEIMATIIEHAQGGADHDTSPACFTLGKIGKELDLRGFSRLRGRNSESSFSVLG
jgi:sarcosine oxidase subunit beta